MNKVKKNSYVKKETLILKAITFIYFFLLFEVLIERLAIYYLISKNEYFNPFLSEPHINLIPFETINSFAPLSPFILGNIVLFVPLSILLKMLFPNINLSRYLLVLLVIPAIVELVQYCLSIGSLDVDDYILNVFGEFVGVSIYSFVFLLCNKNAQKTKTIFIMTALVSVPFLVICFRVVFSDLSQSHFMGIDFLIAIISFSLTCLIIRGAEKWQYKYILISYLLFGIIFYAVIIDWL